MPPSTAGAVALVLAAALAAQEPHWAFVPPRAPAPPAVVDATWCRGDLDRFVKARLEAEGIVPSPEADRRTLLRRVTLDLTGLPPAREEVQAFLADAAQDAYERVVDRLLASPRYGEHMAWAWLEAARYADSSGFQHDRNRTSWPWRDWVVRALNRNQPFDAFAREQIAGDLLPSATREQILATGFQRNHMLNGEGGRDPEESRVETVVDRVEVTATAWLGLTLGCARCHDHKYDPLTQRDFWRFAACFDSIDETGGGERDDEPPLLDLPTPAQEAALAAASARHAAASTLAGSGPSAAAALAMTRVELARLREGVLRTMVLREREEPRRSHVRVRGAFDHLGEPVEPGPPAALAGGAPTRPGRLGLAEWLTAPDHPLLARVAVNRLWQRFFGIGLVKTSEDLGTRGERPSHPELLDWLAVRFASGGHDVKAMVRLLVTSAAYRQASLGRPELQARDPENRLLARQARLRLPSAVLRDQALAVSGLLVERLGGPPVFPYHPDGLWEQVSFGRLHYEQGRGPDLYRRTLYSFWRRTCAPPALFDAADRQACVVKVMRTSSPLHALVLLNDPTYVEAARCLAQRVLHQGGAGDGARLAWAFETVTARPPAAAELLLLRQRLAELRVRYAGEGGAAEAVAGAGEAPRPEAAPAPEVAAWAGVMAVLLNLDETLTRE